MIEEKGNKYKEELPNVLNRLKFLIWGVVLVLIFILVGGSFVLFFQSNEIQYIEQMSSDEEWEEDEFEIVNGQEVTTGLLVDKNWTLIKRHCTQCHTTKIITQNRASREGWENMISWMQETQNLWDLGEDHDGVIDYLTRNYGIVKNGIYSELIIEDWYEIE
jgi:hypothetical protein